MSIKERVLDFISSKNIPISEFERRCSLSNGYISSMRKGFGTGKLDNVLNEFPELNRDWLLYGDGKMLNTIKSGIKYAGGTDEQTFYGDDENNEMYTIPLLPISAQGGTLNDFVVSVKDSDCERVISPVKGADFAMSVAGDSMAPEYPSGSQVLIKKINERAFIDWGKVYVLDTCNGTIIKRLMPTDEKERVKCVSINPEYPPFEVCLSDVHGMYRVLLCMSIK